MQKITYFKGKEYSLKENWDEAFKFASKIVLWGLQNDLFIYSPCAHTQPMAVEWNSDESPEWRKIYFDIDFGMIERFRKAGEVRFLCPKDWFESSGCRLEFEDALKHNDKIVRFEPFYNSGEAPAEEVVLMDDTDFDKSEAEVYAIAEICMKVNKKM